MPTTEFATFGEAKEALKAWDIAVALALDADAALPSKEDRKKAGAAQADLANAWEVRERVMGCLERIHKEVGPLRALTLQNEANYKRVRAACDGDDYQRVKAAAERYCEEHDLNKVYDRLEYLLPQAELLREILGEEGE